MRITAAHIENWAKSSEARSELPRLVRRLIHATSDVRWPDIPAGDEVSRPGWDGVVNCDEGGVYTPVGASYWEMSCEGDRKKKADSDFDKRTFGEDATPEAVRMNSTFLFVTARKWPQGKEKWRQTKLAEGAWRDIKVLDASDLEQWLECAPSVALEYARIFGIAVEGAQSFEQFWRDWSSRSDPRLSPAALFADRTRALQLLNDKLKDARDFGGVINVEGESVEEVTATIAAWWSVDREFAQMGAVILEPNGWRLLETNDGIRLALAATPEVAESAPDLEGLVVVVPYSLGDQRLTIGVESGSDLKLERQLSHIVRDELVDLGIDGARAEKLTANSGRSWSSIRRQLAKGAIAKPQWVEHPDAWVLEGMCLVTSWDDANEVDRKLVSTIFGRPYPEIRAALGRLLELDCAPVIQIGSLWHLKAPLEAIRFIGRRVSDEILESYLATSQRVLKAPDPSAMLPARERRLAAIVGKEREESGLIFASLAKGLVRLAVRSDDFDAQWSADVAERVRNCVSQIMGSPDKVRWLSIEPILQELAEAAPGGFLQVLEADLARSDPTVRVLFETDSDDGFSPFGGCNYANLLWALEILAWSERRLLRVCEVLCRLDEFPRPANWGNSPIASLNDIFRAWIPQTAASAEARVQVLRRLVAEGYPAARELLERILWKPNDHSTGSARPKWREDDYGAGVHVSSAEANDHYLSHANILSEAAKADPRLLPSIVRNLDAFPAEQQQEAIGQIKAAGQNGVTPADREELRNALRREIHLKANIADPEDDQDERACSVDTLIDVYEALAPIDVVERHKWLFAEHWPDLPCTTRSKRDDESGTYDHWQDKEIEGRRAAAIREVWESGGGEAIRALAEASGPWHFLGLSLQHLDDAPAEVISQLIGERQFFDESEAFRRLVAGFLCCSDEHKNLVTLRSALSAAKGKGWGASSQAGLIAAAPVQQGTIEFVETLDEDVQDEFWRHLEPIRHSRSVKLLEVVAEKLLLTGRPSAAFETIAFNLADVRPELLADILEALPFTEESQIGNFVQSRIVDALDALKASGQLVNEKIAQLEFALLPILGHGDADKAEALYTAMTEDPELFVSVVGFVYRSENSEPERELTVRERNLSKIGHLALMYCRRTPGVREGGLVDAEKLEEFCRKADELATERKLRAPVHSNLGHLLSHSPEDLDGAWPCAAVCEVLDTPELEDVRRGFYFQTLNNRGVTSRGAYDGGEQERALASRYREHAHRRHNSHPRAAATLDQIAEHYEKYAQQEDNRAQRTKEGLF